MSLAPHLEALEPVLEHGWRIFPCAQRGKVPLLKNWPRSASSDIDVIRKWAQKHEDCNWGVATGPESRVFAIDIDGESGEESFSSLVDQHGVWTETLAVTTARGQHFYFDWPASGTIRNSAGKLSAGIDVRGDGGYCVIPPSVHPDGPLYRWASVNLQTAPAPDWLLQTITSTARPAVKAEEIGILPAGRRNDGLARLAGAMRRKGATLAEIETALLEHNVRRCRPPLLDYEVRKIAASVSRYAPGGLDPLQSAWQESEGEYSSHYERFLGLANRLQLARPGHAVALPLQRIAALMGVHWNTISRYRSAAVNAGVLQPSGQYIPHRIAGLYRVSGEMLTKKLTSGLVTIPSKPPSYQIEKTPSYQKPLVTAQEEEQPLVTASPVWKTPTFTVLSEDELNEKVRRSTQNAARWREIVGHA